MTGFEYAMPVRYFEIDQQGVVFNGWYLAYLDEAMSAYLSHCGLPYADLLAGGHDLMLVHTELDWTGSLRWGDVGAIAVSTEKLGTTSLTLAFDVRRSGVSVCRARNVYVCIASGTGAAGSTGKRPLPEDLRAVLAG